MQKKQLFGILGTLWLPLVAVAGHQVCGNQEVAANVRKCSDGSIPRYIADEVQRRPSEHEVKKHGSLTQDNTPVPNASDLSYYFRVWRTNIPGGVWTSPSEHSGYDKLHISPGMATGDLLIKSDGTYIWNAYGGKKGSWVQGDAEYPIVLIDTVENRRWRVSIDPKHLGGRDIIVWDGKSIYYNGRK